MKVCEYCGVKAEDDAKECESCGSDSFKNICENCGEQFSGPVCPKCGVAIGQEPRVCFNCGKETYFSVCPDCGTDLINGKQKKVTYKYVDVADYKINKKKKRKHIPLFIILFIIFTISIGVYNESKDKEDVTTKDVYTENKSKVDIVPKTDMEIITMPGHPKLYGNHKEALKFWSNYKKVKPIYTTQISGREDGLLLLETDKGDKGIITTVIINFEAPNELTLNDVTKAVFDYIPFDIVEKYYTFKESYHEIPTEAVNEWYYCVMTLNDEGKAINKNGEVNYNSKFKFAINPRTNGQWVATIGYWAPDGLHYKFPEAYNVEIWDLDFNAFRNSAVTTPTPGAQ